MAGSASSSGMLSKFANSILGKLGSKDLQQNAMARIKRLGMTERQQELNYLWSVYKGQQYASRKLDWNGRESVGRIETDVVSSLGYIPPGFMMDQGSQGSSVYPLKYRKPTAPYALVKIIVDRFTGLLFSENQHPEIQVDGDENTQDWLRAIADVTRLWQQMILARQFGGSTGTVAVGFQFVNGKPIVEVHDPRWLFPEFTEHGSQELVSLEKRYIYTKEMQDETTGRWEQKEFWYRRMIDQQSDTLFLPAPVEDGEEPKWEVARSVPHNFGFCPVIWVQNLPVLDSEDGEPDCPPAVYETQEAVDVLISQAHKGIVANCDPTVVISTDAEMSSIKLGSDAVLKMPKDSTAALLELQASGPKAAMEQVQELRQHALEMSSCVLESPDTTAGETKTATEVERHYEAMWAKADVLREQYGQKGIVPLLEMFFRAAEKITAPRAMPQPVVMSPASPQQSPPGQEQQAGAQGAPSLDPSAPTTTGPQVGGAQEVNDGIVNSSVATIVRGGIVLPPRYEVDELTGQKHPVQRVQGSGGTITLKWPGYTQPSLDDMNKAVTGAAAAKEAGLIDDKTAIESVAPFFKVEDVSALVQNVRANVAQQQADLMAQMTSAVGGGDPGEEPHPPAQVTKPFGG